MSHINRGNFIELPGLSQVLHISLRPCASLPSAVADLAIGVTEFGCRCFYTKKVA